MQEFLNKLINFFKNKNVLTVVGVIVIVALLYIGYSYQINKAVDPQPIYVATEDIPARTLITEDMVELVDVPNVAVSEDVLLGKANIVGKYSSAYTLIPKGSMFYKNTVVDYDQLPDSAFTEVAEDEIPYNFAVDMESTYGNSIYPGNVIDIYMKAEDDHTKKVMVGKFVENVKVLAVKDTNGNNVFEDAETQRTPAYLTFGLKSDIYLLFKKASYLSGSGVELYPVPHGGNLTTTDSDTVVTAEQLKNYIESHSVNVKITESEKKAIEKADAADSNTVADNTAIGNTTVGNTTVGNTTNTTSTVN